MLHRSFGALTKYTAHSTTIIFIIGFIFDMFILPDIDELFARVVGASYLATVALLIIFREWLISRNTASQFEQKVYSVATFGISYFSGSSLSFVFVYALRSAALSVSWPLFVILLLCILANEFVSTHNFRFTLDVGVLLISTLFYIVFNVPLILKVQNDATFGISVAIAISVSLLYVSLLKYSSENAGHEAPRSYALAIGIPMFVGMLYFLNILPAVPLSLRTGDVYHSLTREIAGDFIGQKEVDTRLLAQYRTPVIHLSSQDSTVYFFSSVNAPAELSAPLSHVWEQYDDKTRRWIPSTVISFGLSGGRENGYRAFSQKDNITEGLWRVTVKVDGNRIVGRVKFQVIKTDAIPKIVEVTL